MRLSAWRARKPVTDPNKLGLRNIHPPQRCEGSPCAFHNATDHFMRDWPVMWRADRPMLERFCPKHGIGHPDSDQVLYWNSIHRGYEAVHGCCGCCWMGAQDD